MPKINPLLHLDRFKGRVAIVTGGSAGIGKATAEELCKEGASVAYTSLPEDGGVTLQAFKEKAYDVIEFTGDMSDEAFCREAVKGTLEKWGRIDHLVNNAFSFNAKGMDSERRDWERVMNVGPVAFALMTQLVAEAMKEAGGGSIVNLSSISAHIAQPNRWTYNAAKGAVDLLTKCSAMDLGPSGIRVNSVSPGFVWTREVAKAADGDREKWEPVWGDFSYLGRVCEPVEVARTILFLLSDDASFITGADLLVDGGYCAMGPEGIGKQSRFAGTD